ncbi:DMT family transporter, partial [Candidatus Bathyarchaeota archaeon]|nr:DMT family transporter [Candidatus Bathyarchaeota archaeon]
MLGEAFAVLAAILWAGSMVVAAKTLKDVGPVRANALKTLFSVATMLPIAFLMGEFQNLFYLDFYGSLYVIIAAIIGFGIGDTLIFRSIGLIGVSRSYTIGYSYPFFAIALATVFLGEPFLLRYIFGAVIIFFGIVNIVLERNVAFDKSNAKGFILAFAAAISWSIGTTLVALGLRTVNIIQANTIRFPLLFIFLFIFSILRPGESRLNKENLSLLLLSGILGMTIGGIVFLFSIQLIGVARAAPLSSSSPLWAAIMSSLYLKEKITWRVIMSSIMV